MTDDQVVDTVAQAIRLAVGGRIQKARAWGDLPEQLRADYRKEARAAITAYESARRS